MQLDRLRGCIERLGGRPSNAKTAIGTLIGAVQALATAPFEDEVLKNTLVDYAAEHFCVAAYTALIAAARDGGDAEVAHLLEQTLVEEEDMAHSLEQYLPMLTQETLRRRELHRRSL